MMKGLSERWMKFWFEPKEPTSLGVCRMLFFGIFFLFYLPRDFSSWAEVSKAFWMPIGLFEFFHIPVLPKEILSALQLLWKAAIFLSCVGLWTRASSATSFIIGFYLLGLPHNFGKTHHYDAMVVLILGIMALSYAGDAWSVDRLIQAGRGGSVPSDIPKEKGEYTWPIRAVWVVISIILFAAGVSKLRHSGIGWITSDNMSLLLIQQNYHLSNADPITSLGLHIAQHKWIPRLIAALTIMFEVGYPLALFSRRARWVMVPGTILMLSGIRVLMGPTFWPFIFCHIFWVPWDRVGFWLRDLFPKQKALTVVFDGGCGLCQGTIRVIRSLDLTDRIEFYDVLSDWTIIKKRFPRLNQEVCLADMQAVTAAGMTFAGYDAYRRIAWLLPLTWLVAPFLYLPLVRPIGTCVYKKVAVNRHQGSCSVKRE